MIDILLVEDHPQVRRLLRELLATYADLCIVGEAQSGEEALSLVATVQPAVVIIDIHPSSVERDSDDEPNPASKPLDRGDRSHGWLIER